MKKAEIIKAMAARKGGQFFTLNVKRQAKKLKAYNEENLEKQSMITCQLASYARRQPVMSAIQAGVRDTPKTPQWVQKVEKIGELTFWQHSNGQEYLAAPMISSHKVAWLENGVITDLAHIKNKLQKVETTKKPSKAELAQKGQVRFVAVKLENILDIA